MHAKWAFVLLALVFAVGFVVFGVGSGSTGVSSALQNAFNFGGGSGGASISKLEKQTAKNPLDAKAWRDLATAYETKHRTQDAINALEQYTGLRPRNQDALIDLAGQYQTLANQYASDYSAAQAELGSLQLPASAFPPPASTPFGKAFTDPNALQDPIAAAVQAQVSQKTNTALSNYQSAQSHIESAYQRLAKLSPDDPSTQILLARAAESANDPKTAIAAYKRFLKLAPSDSSAPTIRQQLKQLEQQVKAASG